MPGCLFLRSNYLCPFTQNKRKHSSSQRRPSLSLTVNCLIIQYESGGLRVFEIIHATVRKYKFRIACRIHVMDRKSCRNRRKKSCTQTTWVTWHKKRTTPHCSRGGFCACVLHGFATFTASASKSQTCSNSKEKTHDFMHIGHEIIALLSRHDNCNVVNILFIYSNSIKKHVVLIIIKKEIGN